MLCLDGVLGLGVCLPTNHWRRMRYHPIARHAAGDACSMERQEFPAPCATPSPPCSRLQNSGPRLPTWHAFAPPPSQLHRPSQGAARRLLGAQQAGQQVSPCEWLGQHSRSRSQSGVGQAEMPPRRCFEGLEQILEACPMGLSAVGKVADLEATQTVEEGGLTTLSARRGYQEHRPRPPNQMAQKGGRKQIESR